MDFYFLFFKKTLLGFIRNVDVERKVELFCLRQGIALCNCSVFASDFGICLTKIFILNRHLGLVTHDRVVYATVVTYLNSFGLKSESI